MRPVAVVSDRACDLTPAQQREHGVTIVPLVVRFGHDVLEDDGSFTLDAFWERVAAGGPPPQTSQPSIGAFEAAFAPLVEAGHDVVCPVLSGRLSGTANSAFAAAKRFAGHVSVHDTRALSVAQGFQVLAAARAAQAGASVREILAQLEGMRERTRLYIMLETVEFLRRGGRAGAIMPLIDRITRALRVRPLLHLADGALRLAGAARTVAGARSRMLAEIARTTRVELLAIGHTRRPDEAAELAALAAERFSLSPDDVTVAEAGPALASHGGPGILAAAVLERA
jgi:DegV family protein with EDD domain